MDDLTNYLICVVGTVLFCILIFRRYIKRLLIALILTAILFSVLYQVTAFLWREFMYNVPTCIRRTILIQPHRTVNVGILLMATGKYAEYVSAFVDAGRTFFLSSDCPSSNERSVAYKVTYFIFSDRLEKLPQGQDIVPLFQKRLGWPGDSMLRCSVYTNASQHYNRATNSSTERMDYLFSMDTDVRFIRPVGEEIISDLVGTIHPGYVGEPGQWDKNPDSSAFVKPGEGVYYYTGAIFGGQIDTFLKVCSEIDKNVRIDTAKNVIAVWHDESHLNHYFIRHPPTRILSPLHYWPEEWEWNFAAKILALRKVHADMRAL